MAKSRIIDRYAGNRRQCLGHSCRIALLCAVSSWIVFLCPSVCIYAACGFMYASEIHQHLASHPVVKSLLLCRNQSLILRGDVPPPAKYFVLDTTSTSIPSDAALEMSERYHCGVCDDRNICRMCSHIGYRTYISPLPFEDLSLFSGICNRCRHQ